MSKSPFHFQSTMILWGPVVLLGLEKHQEGGQEKCKVKTWSISQISVALALEICLPSLMSQLSDGKENGQWQQLELVGHQPRCTHIWIKDKLLFPNYMPKHAEALLQCDEKEWKNRQILT